MRFRLLLLVLAVGFACPAPRGYAMAQGQISRTALETKLRQMYPSEDGDVRYFRADVDLNDDGTKETVVYIIGPMVCGTGGCNTLVLAPGKAGPRLVANIFVTHPPIAVAATRTHGWRDLVVSVGGGGIRNHEVLLRFNGNTYPRNPTVQPNSVSGDHVSNSAMLIRPFSSYTEGLPLRPGG